MNTIDKKIRIFLGTTTVLFFIIFLFPVKSVFAAEFYLKTDSQKITVGDTIAVDVIVNTEGESINVIEGNINISKGLDLVDIKELSLANSVFTKWVRTPSWSKEDGMISFIGGIPGGYNQKVANLFRIFFTAKAAGQLTFSPSDIKTYANDGLATQIGTHFNPLNISVGPKDNFLVTDELQAVLNKDSEAPINISFDLGQDSSLFDGQKFINISAVDNESGIAYFEVKEGNREPVKTNNSYVLQNQDNLEPLIILAFDKAGNVSRKSLVPHSNAVYNNYLVIINLLILMIGLLASLFVLIRIIKKKKKAKK
jgi:hypothetical protein